MVLTRLETTAAVDMLRVAWAFTFRRARTVCYVGLGPAKVEELPDAPQFI